MASTAAPALSHAQIEQFVGIGFYVQALADIPNLTMPAVMTELLSTHTPASFNTTVPGKFLTGAGLDPYITLEKLALFLPTLSRETKTTSEIRLYLVLLVITIVVVAMRMYARLAVRPKRMSLEDWWCLVATALLIMLTVCFCAQNIHRFHGWAGNHIYTLTLAQTKNFAQYVTANEVIFHVTHFFVKMTFLVFYYRLNPNPLFRKAVYAVVFYVFGLTFAGVMVAVFQCNPVDYWNHFATAKCIDQVTSSVSVGIMFIVADFAILLLPIPAVWKLKLKTTEKLLVIGMFALGGLISIFSVIRVIALRQWLETIDLTWSVQKHARWAMLELDLSIIVSCAPALKALFQGNKSMPDIPSNVLARFSFKRRDPTGLSTTGKSISTVQIQSHTLQSLERMETGSVKDDVSERAKKSRSESMSH